jgi:hypothetical protein
MREEKSLAPIVPGVNEHCEDSPEDRFDLTNFVVRKYVVGLQRLDERRHVDQW